jgi:histone H3
MAENGGEEMRIQRVALLALQEAAEALLVTELECKVLSLSYTKFCTNLILVTQLAAIHAKRVTIQQKDMKLVQAMRFGMLGIHKVGERIA